MSGSSGHQQYRNKLLRGSDGDIDVLEPHLTFVDLPLRARLENRNRPIQFAYFIEQGLASVVAGAGATVAEVGVIGSEGVCGLALILGMDRSPHDNFMQVRGAAYRIPAADLQRAMTQRPALHAHLLKFVYVFNVQAASTALANARHKLEARLARWLLMADDRLDGDAVTLTHEFLAVMLGVRRPGVTIAVSVLTRQGLILPERGSIRIIDRPGLRIAANGCYGAAEIEYRRVFGA